MPTEEPGKSDSPAGKVYEQLVATIVAAEFDRKKTLEGRGATILTASGTLLTLIFGVTVLVTGKDYVFGSGLSALLLMASLAAFVVSATIAIFIAAYGTAYTLVGRETLERLTGDEFWENKTEDDARRMWVQRQVNTIKTLRTGNDRKATAVIWSLVAQVVAVSLLSASVAVELWPCPDFSQDPDSYGRGWTSTLGGSGDGS